MAKDETKVVAEIVPIKEQFNKLGEVQRSFTQEQVKFITESVAPGLTNNEVWLFLLKASLLKLNPLTQEIYAYSQTDKETGRRQLVTIVARNGKRVIAERSGKLEWVKTEAIYTKKVKQDEQEITIKVEPWDGDLWGAECIVKRSDVTEPFKVIVRLAEYKRNNRVWNGIPDTMIKKVAESQCLSMAFPEMGGVYDEAEKWETEDAPAQTAPTQTDDNEPVTAELTKTLEAMGCENAQDFKTKGEARAEIARLSTKKGKGK